MVGFARLLRDFRELLETDDSQRWYCYKTTAGVETLLVKDQRSHRRYLVKTWDSKNPLGAARVTKVTERYVKYKGQEIFGFALLARSFRTNAFGLTQLPVYRESLGLFQVEPHSDRVVHSYPRADSFFRTIEAFLKRAGFATQSLLPKELRQDLGMKVYLDSTALVEFLRTRRLRADLLRRGRDAAIQFVSSSLALQQVMLVSRHTKSPTPRQILDFLTTTPVSLVEVLRTPERLEPLSDLDLTRFKLHTADILSLVTAADVGCKFLLTLDADLQAVRGISGMKVISPREFLKILR